MKAIANRLTQVARMAALAFAVLAVGTAWAATAYTGTVYEPWSYSTVYVWRVPANSAITDLAYSTFAPVASGGTVGEAVTQTGNDYLSWAADKAGYVAPGKVLCYDATGYKASIHATFTPLSFGGLKVDALADETAETPYTIVGTGTRNTDFGYTGHSTYFEFNKSFTVNRSSATRCYGAVTIQVAQGATFKSQAALWAEIGGTVKLTGGGTVELPSGLYVNNNSTSTLDLSAATRPTINGNVTIYEGGAIALPAGTEPSEETPFTVCSGTLAVGTYNYVKIGDADPIPATLTVSGGAITGIESLVRTFTSDYPTVVPAGAVFTFQGGTEDEPVVLDARTVNGTLKTEGYFSFTSYAAGTSSTLEVVSGKVTLDPGNNSFRGTLTVDAGATFVNKKEEDAVQYGGTFTANIYGTLDMGATRWSLGSNNTLNFHEGCTVTGSGQSSNGTFDWIENATGTLNVDGDVTLAAPIKIRSTATVNVNVDTTDQKGLTLAGTIGSGAIVKKGAGLLKFTTNPDYAITCENGAFTFGVDATPTITYSAKPGAGTTMSMWYATQDTWKGTVVIGVLSAPAALPLNAYGNANSKIVLTGTTGSCYLNGTTTVAAELVVGANENSVVEFNNGNSNQVGTFNKVSGSGTLKLTGWAGCSAATYVVNTDNFTGTLVINNGITREQGGKLTIRIGNIVTTGATTPGSKVLKLTETNVSGATGEVVYNLANAKLNGAAANLVLTSDGVYVAAATVTKGNTTVCYPTVAAAMAAASTDAATIRLYVDYANSVALRPGQTLVTGGFSVGGVSIADGVENGYELKNDNGTYMLVDNRTSEWTGDGANNSWSTAANWSTGFAPTQYTTVTFPEDGAPWTVDIVGGDKCAAMVLNGNTTIAYTGGSYAAFSSYGGVAGTGTLTLSNCGFNNASSAAITIATPVESTATSNCYLPGSGFVFNNTVTILAGMLKSEFAPVTFNGKVTICDSAKVQARGDTGPVTFNGGIEVPANASAYLEMYDGELTIASKVTLASGASLTVPASATTTSATFEAEDSNSYVKSEISDANTVYSVETYKTVTFLDEDGETVLQTVGNLRIGDTPAYTEATPTKAATAQYTYTFTGWTPEVVAVTGDATYTATYDSTVNQYTLTVPEVANATATVTVDDEPTDARTFDYGTVVTVTYTPDTYYSITAGDAAQVITITANTYAVAPTVTRNTVTVTVPTVDNASVNVAYTAGGVSQTGTTADTYTVDQGTAVIVTYTAGEGYFFGDEATKVLEYTTVVTAPEITTADTGATSAAVAKIDTTYYPTLASAMSDATVSATAQSPVTVTMLTACTESATITVPVNVTLDINGKGVTSGVKVVLNGGTLVNNGPSYNTYDAAGDPAIVAELELTADSTVGGTGNFHIRAANHAESKLTLNGYTLTKSGTNTFFLDNTQSDEAGDKVGTINVVGGHLGIFRWGISYTGVNLDCNVELNNGSSELFFAYNYAKATIRNLSGSGKVTGSYTGIDLLITGSLTLPIYQAPTPSIALDDGSTLVLTATGLDSAYGNKLVVGGTSTVDVDLTALTINEPVTLLSWTTAPAGSFTTDDLPAAYKLVKDTDGLKVAYNQYTITWVVDGASSEETYDYGATPTRENPTRTATAQYTYTFAGWTPEVVPATATATYTAQFSETVNQYTLTVSEVANATATVTVGGEPTDERTFDYGTVVTVTWAPVSSAWKVTSNAQVIELTGNVTAEEPTVAPNEKTFTVVVPDNMTVTVDGVPYTANTEITRTIGTSVTIVYTVAGQFVGETQQQEVEITGDTVTIGTPDGYVAPVPAVAQVGTTYFADFASALAAVPAQGDTVTLLAPLALSSTVTLDKSVTLDLNGFDVTATDCRAFHVTTGSFAITGEGTVSTVVTPGTSLSSSSSVIRVGDGFYATDTKKAKATLTIGAKVTVSTDWCYGVTVFGVNTDGMELVVDGTVAVTGTASAISGNGTSTLSATAITVNGTVTATGDYAIYHPGKGTLAVNGTVTGPGGIEMKGGSVTVNANATVTATAEEQSHSAYNNGASTVGYAIAAVSNPNYVGDPAVAISGTVNGKVIILADFNAENVGVVTASVGTLATDSDYKWVEDANGYKLVAKTYVAEVAGQGYETFAEALAQAEGKTLKLLAPLALTSTVTIDKDVTLDLNGNNVTATDCRAFHVTAGTVALTGAGTVSTVVTPGTSFSSSSSVIRVGSDTAVTSFTLGEDVTVASDYCYGITYFGREAQTVVIDGTVAVTGAQAAISGNGNSWNAPVTLTVNGTVTATQDYAIYNPQRGTTTISGTVTGLGGIEMKAGTLTVGANAAITATAATQSHSTNNNGTSTTGYAIASVGNAAYPGDPVVTINGGTITGKAIVLAENGAEEAGTIVATVATISTDPDYKWVEGDTAGTYKLVAKTYVAEVGGQGYETLASALAAAPTDGTATTVTLLADVDAGTLAVNGGRNVVLDLGGKTLTPSFLYVLNGALEIANGTLAGTVCVYGLNEEGTGMSSTFTLAAGATVDSEQYGVIVYEYPGTHAAYDAAVTIAGTVNGNVWVMGNIEEGDSTLTVSGTVDATGKSDVGIALNGAVALSVVDGASVESDGTGIEVRAGALSVTGGTIVGNGVPASSQGNNNGTTSTGAGIAVSTYDLSDVSVSVTGGEVKGYAPLYVVNTKGTSENDLELSVSGGTFTTINGGPAAIVVDASEARAVGFVSGGTFSTAVDEAVCATGYIPVDNGDGTYGVEAGEYSVYIGEDCYETLEDALADAEDGATLKVVRDIEVTSTVVIDKSVTIDLNGNDIVATNVRALWVKAGTVELTGEGTISANGDGLGATSSVIRVGDGADNTALAKLTVGEGVTVSTAKSYGITTFGKNTLGVELELYGKVIVTSTGKADAAISGNGSKGLASTTITVKEGAVVSAANGAGIYFPGAGTLTVEGGSITGPTAVYVKSGNVKISGGELTGNGEETAYTYTGDGLKATGDALVVESCGYPNGAPTALVTGGTLVSANAKAIGCYATTGNSVPKNIVPAKVNGAINPARFGDADAMGIAAGYKLVADGNLFKVARVENTVAGTVDVVSVSDTTLVTVPANCNADQLINTTNRAEGDILKAYVKSAGRYFTWKLENIDNDPVWTPVQTWLVGANPSDSTKPAAEVQLKKGEAVWVTRVNSSEPVLVNGSYAETQGASTVTVETGYNLVAPVPTATEAAAAEVVINEVVEKSNNTVNDKILVPPTESSAPVTLNCKYNESTKKHEWGYDFIETYTDDDGNLRSRKVRKTDVKIPSGTGFWYISGGNKEISL